MIANACVKTSLCVPVLATYFKQISLVLKIQMKIVRQLLHFKILSKKKLLQYTLNPNKKIGGFHCKYD